MRPDAPDDTPRPHDMPDGHTRPDGAEARDAETRGAAEDGAGVGDVGVGDVQEAREPTDAERAEGGQRGDSRPKTWHTPGRSDAERSRLDERPSYDQIDLPEGEDEVRELLKRTTEASNNSVLISDPTQPDNPIVYVNQGFKRLTGYPEDQILGRNCRFLQRRSDGTYDDDQPGVRALHKATKNGDFCRAVLRNYTREGVMFWNELYVTPVYDEDGTLTNFIGVQNDITERVELNQSLEQRVRERTQALEQKTRELQQKTRELEEAKDRAEAASRAKSAFLANMSHEIRTPLTAILGLADVIRVKSAEGQFEEHTRRIKSAGSRLMDTLSSLLMLAKLESDSMEVEFEPVRLDHQADEVVELFRERAEAKGLGIDLHVGDAARGAVARLDAGALNSALQNLIANAIKFTESGRIDVHVHVDRGADTAALAVHDTGIGISDDFKPYLFDDFSQESEGLTREYDGSGLGLSITKQLVEAMDGSIRVASTRGEGSTFTITFPLASTPDHDSAGADTGDEAATPDPDGARVLLVEDNDNTVFLIQNLMASSIHLDAASDAASGYDLATSHDYDLLLFDINLGAGGSGVDLQQRLRSEDRYTDTPIVAVTAIAMPGDREKLLDQGFDDYLAKPFEAGDLYALLDRYLQPAE